MTRDPITLAEDFRDLRPRPDTSVIALLLGGDAARAHLVGVEIERVERGEVPPIQVDVDPISAFVLLTYLEMARELSSPANAANPIVDKFIAGLEACVGRDCPEIARVLTDVRAARKGGRS